MTYHMTCTICEYYGAEKPYESKNLVAMQEHVMQEHGYTQEDLQKQRKEEIEGGYLYFMPDDGFAWLRAIRGSNTLSGL